MTAMDDVLLNKAATIKRCLQRIREEYNQDPLELKTNYTKQDSVLLNLQRACEAAIDMANRCIRLHRGGIPQSGRDSFNILHRLGVLDQASSIRMQRMVGLRNVAVHDYQELNMDIVISVLDHHLSDFEDYVSTLLKQAG